MALNPTITKKVETPLTLTDNAKKLFQVIYEEKNKKDKDDEKPRIKVSELISRMAFYYEKIRNAVDYKEENLLRKNAILRILKRQVIIEGANKETKADEIGEHLLTELIRGGYLPNNKILESKIEETGEVTLKYLKIRNLLLAKRSNEDKNDEIISWLLAMCACEIEERLCQDIVTQTIIKYMYEVLNKEIGLSQDSPYEKDKEIQIYLSIHRVYSKFDRDMVEFSLIKYFNANWLKITDEELFKFSNNLEALRLAITNQVNHPLGNQFDKIVNRYAVYFSVLHDVIDDDPVKVYEAMKEDPKSFPRNIKKFCDRRYRVAKTKLRRAAVRSIIYIFLTKMILALILEIPATLWLGEIVNYMSLAVNVGFPPLLLFFIVLLTRVPSEANSNKVVEGIGNLVFQEKERQEPIQLKKPVKRSRAINITFGIIYSITFFLTFGLVIWLLNKIHFNIISVLIFLFFLTLVSFFGIRIRKVAKEMFIVEPKENLISFLVDFFYLPIIAAGKWLNEKFSRLNIFVFILDFIIEAPFKIFVEIAEDWTKYVKERKEEIM